MTVEESKALRKALESDILILLQKFQSDTGLSPSGVYVDHLENHPIALPRERRVIQVKVEVAL